MSLMILLSGNAEPQLGINNYQAKPELGTSGSVVGWHSRGYLPHFDTPSVLQSMTFRLADSLPPEKLRELERELAVKPDTERDAARRRIIETWLDAGIGCCALRHPELAMLMQETLLKFDGNRYRLLAWCVMPNHVHVLIEPITSLSKIVQSWKSFTGRWALAHNTMLGLGVPGKRLWMRDYWDRYIRHQQHLDAVVAYIHNNPVTAGLCGRPQAWPWSSAACFKGRAQELRSDQAGGGYAELGLGVPKEQNHK